MQIKITDRAMERLRIIADQEGVDLSESMLRIAVVPGGCSGLTYDLGWDTALKADDETSQLADFTVVMDLKSRLYMDGSELDFSEGLEGKGFYFENPQAQRNCACGESFGV